MNRILVVGATGQLGRAAIRKLAARGATLRAMVRTEAATRQFQQQGIATVLADLTDRRSLDAACAGIQTIVATANSALPARPADSFANVERDGYRNLIAAAQNAGVRHIVYTSFQGTNHGGSRFLRYKRETEEALQSSGIPSTVFRAGIFMDIAFAMMGSDLPLRGVEGASILRPFHFTTRHFAGIRNSIAEKQVALVPGKGDRKHPFICVDDVASYLAAAALGNQSGVYIIGGPEPLSYLDVVRLYERVLGVSLKVKSTPAFVFRVLSVALKPFNPAGANLMYLNYLSCTHSTQSDATAPATFGVRLTTAESFLRQKLSLSA